MIKPKAKSSMLITFFVILTTSTAIRAFAQVNERIQPSGDDCIKSCLYEFSDPRKLPKLAGKELLKLVEELDKEESPEKAKILKEKMKGLMEKYNEKLDDKCEKVCDVVANFFKK